MRVLLLKEDAVWIAQCLEYDIAAQGTSITEAKAAFVLHFAAQIEVALKHGDKPLADFASAPQNYWDRFSASERLADPIRVSDPIEIPPAFMINAMQRTLADSWISV